MEAIGALHDYANTPTNCSLSIAMHLSNCPQTTIQEQQNRFNSNSTHTTVCH